MAFRSIIAHSPNFDRRPQGVAIDMLVLHYTGMKSAENAISRLCDPAAKVSAHYTIDREGCVYAHVAEEMRAWHAGVSYWAGAAAVNGRSIGIELVNPGHEFGYVPYTDVQIEALIELAKEILSRHPIPPNRVLGHSDVAPSRKTDPGELFPWRRLAEYGIGLFPNVSAPALAGEVRPKGGKGAPSDLSAAARSAQAEAWREAEGADVAVGLSRFGYGVPPQVDVPLEAVISAFQRHFRPEKIDGIWDGECQALLGGLPASIV